MKVLQIVPYFLPATQYGGPVRVVHGLSKALIKQGCEVTVATTTANGRDELDAKTATIDGVCIHYFKRIRLEKLFSHIPYLGDSVGFFFSRELRRYLLNNISKFDIIHLHDIFTYPVLAAGTIAFERQIPYVVHVHGMLNEFAMKRRKLKKEIFLRLFGAEVLQQANALIALTNWERQEIIKSCLAAAPRVIPNGTSLDGIPKTNGGHKNGREILYLGRIHPVKGLDLLIEAFSTLAKADMNLNLVIAGPDEIGYQRELETFCKQRNISAQVRFVGHVADEQKYSLLHRADVFALTSYSEGFSISVLEALSCGKPVVISEGCHFPAVEETGAGFVTDNNVETISQRLATLLYDDKLRAEMSKNAVNLVQESYTWDIVADKTIELYQQILTDS